MLHFSVPLLINLLSAIAILTMGFFVMHRNRKDVTSQLFGTMTIFITMWIFTSTLSDAVDSLRLAHLLGNSAIVGPFIVLALMYVFARAFPYERAPMRPRETVILFLPILLSLPFVWTRYNIVEVTKEEWGTNFVPGPLYTVLLLYIVAVFAFAARELYLKWRQAKEAETRAQILFLFLGFGTMFLFGMIANLILPLLGDARASTIGPASTIFFVIFTAYAIVKHHLLDVKVVAAEFFGAVLALITFVQIFTSQTTFDYAIRITGFVLISFFAVLFVLSVLREVEQRQEVERLADELRKRNVQLKKLDGMKSTMVSIASHQLRGPLGGMRGYLTMFRDGDLGPLTDEQKEIVKMNLSTLSRLLNAVETFLDITKIEAGKMVLRKEVLPLDVAVHEVAHELEVMLKKKGLALETDIEEHVWVEFDPEKIKHVIFNLIDNAMKYTDEGGITVTLHREGGEAVIQVTDTGKGIPKEDLPRLFGKFERGELTVDRGGSGLGLYIVKMLTEMQGGSVDVTSPGPGKGSTFHIRLPTAKTPH